MLKQIIEPAIANLLQSEVLLSDLDPMVYSNKSAAPYYSSVGGHLRHVFDIYQCILNGIDSKLVDLTDRKRGVLAEESQTEGLKYLKKLISGLESISSLNPEISIVLKDNLGQGMVDVPSTLGGGLCQANSHAIHHYACIGYLLHIFGVQLPNKRFGYNPTTPMNKTI